VQQNYTAVSEYLTDKNISHTLASGEQEVRIDCPQCGDTKQHLYISNQEGCFFCQKCQWKGSWTDLLTEIDETEVVSLSNNTVWQLVPKVEKKILDPQLATQYHQQLPERILKYLQSIDRGLSLESIEKYQLGWDGNSITIPVFDEAGQLVNIRHRRDPAKAKEDGPKIWGEKGYGVSLFNVGILQQLADDHSYVVLCEGEFDAIKLNQQAFPTVTGGGAGIFKQEWVPYFDNIKTIYICYDTDETGKQGAAKVAQYFGDRAKIVTLPSSANEKVDVTKFCATHSVEDFQTLLDSAEAVQGATSAKTKQDEKKKHEKQKEKPNEATFLILENGSLAEEIVDVQTGMPWFLVYDQTTTQTRLVHQLVVRGKTFVPLHDDLVTKSVVRFPSQISDYGNFQELYNEVRQFIYRYADMSPFFLQLATYYVFLTWLFDTTSTITYLGIFSPEKGAGKTRIAKTIGALCYKPILTTGSITPPVIFRLLEKVRGTLVLNEFDFDNSDLSSEVIKILNNGYETEMSVLRIQINGDSVQAFDAYGPKIFTYRRKKKDEAFESRMVTIPAEETTREDIPIELPRTFWHEALMIRNKLLLYRFQNHGAQPTVDTARLIGLNRRLRQTLYPLLRVIPDQVFLDKLIKFAKEYQETERADREASWVANALRVLVNLTLSPETITVQQFAKQLTSANVYESSKEETVTARKAGSIVRNHLKLTTKRISAGPSKGQYEVVIDAPKVLNLCEKYGVEIPAESSLHSPSSPSSGQASERSDGSEDQQEGPLDHGDF